MPSVSLSTYADIVAHALDYLGGATDAQNERYARRAIQAAVSEYWSVRTWNYSYKRGRIYTQTPYQTGTVQYLVSSGAVPRQMTLTGGTWPAWAADGQIQITTGNQKIPYGVASRVSNTVIQLQQATAPPADITVDTAYVLVQEQYPLPVDFGAAGEIVNMGFARVMLYQTPDEFIRQQRVNVSPANPWMYTIMGDQRRYGGLVLGFYPAPDTQYTMDYIYQRQGRALSMHGAGVTPYTQITAGKASVASASTTVTGIGTAWTPDMVGCVIRFAAQPASKIPTGQGGDSPFYLQRTLLGWTSATQMTLDQVPGIDLTGVPYSISDPVDIEAGAMSTYFLREVEKQLRAIRRIETTKSMAMEYQQALNGAFEADSRHYENRSTFSSTFSAVRIASMPSGRDIT